MAKHETTFIPEPAIDPDLLRRTETAVLVFMAANDGQRRGTPPSIARSPIISLASKSS
jgi:hypothetical protein